MKTFRIPEFDLKFVKSTTKNQCPKCGSKDFFDTGHRANNVKGADVTLDVDVVPEHPIFRCNSCAQLFRNRYPENKK